MVIELARVRQKAKDDFFKLKNNLENLLNSPLSGLARELLNLLIEPDLEKKIDYVSKIYERLPKDFDENFYFNSWMIQSIIKKWSSEIIPYCGRIIPTPYHIWAYEQIPIPVYNKKIKKLILYLVYIPFENNHQIPSLLDYPFLLHELGHYLLTTHDKTFKNNFLPHLNKKIYQLKQMSISDRGDAKKKSQKYIDEFNMKWNFDTKINKSSWGREIAVDIIALWACGPAYLETFHYHHKNVSNPFDLETEHPPVELRTYVLIQAAIKLSWENYISSLVDLQKDWTIKIPATIRNRYSSLRCDNLIDACIQSTINYCEYLKIPRLKYESLTQLKKIIEYNEELSDGIDLIVRAWLICKEKGEKYYDEWESKIVKKIMNEITQ